jgi:hypothetical protein
MIMMIARINKVIAEKVIMRVMTLWPQMPLLVQVILNFHAGSTREALTKVLLRMQLPNIHRKKNFTGK